MTHLHIAFRRTLIAAATVATLAAPFAALSQETKPRLIRFGYGLNEASNQGRAAKVFANAVDKASGGKMKVRAMGAAALGPDTQIQQALIGGAQEMMVGSRAVLLGGPIGERIEAKLQDNGLVGLVGLVYWENGFRNLTNSKRPVTKLEDLYGVKLRVTQNNVFLNSFNTLGAHAVLMRCSCGADAALMRCRCRFQNYLVRWKPRRLTARKSRPTPSCQASFMKCRST